MSPGGRSIPKKIESIASDIKENDDQPVIPKHHQSPSESPRI